MRWAVLVFPGTWSDRDWQHVLTNVLHQDAERVWQTESDLSSFDAIVIPGGFAFGDYLRTGALARFAPVMAAVKREATKGKLVIGSCNGFQILCEAGLLPGALLRNADTKFHCHEQHVRVETKMTPFTVKAHAGEVLQLPISHGEGNYFADSATIDLLNRQDRVVLRYCGPHGETTDDYNPNGSLQSIAGIVNEDRNVFGLMPHPERVAEEVLGSIEGLKIISSMLFTSEQLQT